MFSKIAISGKICTGKTTLFKNLQKKLKWKIFSVGQYFRQYVKNHHLTLENAEEQNDKLTRQIDFKAKRLLKTKKHIILEGWMAGIMANDIPCTLRVFLTCDDKIRIKRFCQREKISYREAKKKILTREKNLFQKLKQIYHRSDFTTKKNYDLIINTSFLTPQEILDKVLNRLTS